MKSGLLKKLLLFVFITLIVNALMTVGVFTYTSRNVYANEKADELVPKASFIASMVSQYQRGEISKAFLEFMLNSDRSLLDATVHVFGTDGEVIAQQVGEGDETREHLRQYFTTITGGAGTTIVTTSQELGIVVGTPIYGVDAKIMGAVILTKPLTELSAALDGLNTALVISTSIVIVLLLLPAYLGSKQFTQPLLQMSIAAKEMAKGNFSVRAGTSRKDEVGQLGRSLNELSETLSATIGDLMRERNRLRHVLDGLREGIVAVDTEGNVTHSNPAAHAFLNCAAGEGQQVLIKLRALWPGLDAAATMDDTCETTISCSGLELKVTLTPLYDAQGHRFGSVAMIQDVTEEMRLEQTRRDYVANVSHELRTPIASIRGLAEALDDGMVKKEEDKQRYYGYILRESMRLSRLIDDLLELSRLQSGNVALHCYTFDLNHTLHELTERFEVIAGDSGLQFRLQAGAGETTVHSNADRVEQVLVALLDNAVKFAADNGTVSLKVEAMDDHYLISVCNTGAIAEEHLPHLFERFYKADIAHSGQGTGLGLSIARQVMDLLGEKIWAENCGDEACFRFTLHRPATASLPSSACQTPAPH